MPKAGLVAIQQRGRGEGSLVEPLVGFRLDHGVTIGSRGYRTTRNSRCVAAGVAERLGAFEPDRRVQCREQGRAAAEQDRDDVHGELVDQAERERLLHDRRAKQADDLVGPPSAWPARSRAPRRR